MKHSEIRKDVARTFKTLRLRGMGYAALRLARNRRYWVADKTKGDKIKIG
jgi:hypothetical protein